VTGTWWIPLLVVVGFWRHVVERIPLTYDPQYWSLVFQLGMYTVATLMFANATGMLFPADHSTHFCLHRDASLVDHVQCDDFEDRKFLLCIWTAKASPATKGTLAKPPSRETAVSFVRRISYPQMVF
jgi:hypothetical protein